jgi:hypothetical protein
MKIVAVKIKDTWYRAASVLPVLCEYYPLFPVSRLRCRVMERLEARHGFTDTWKYSVYNMREKKFVHFKRPDEKPF